MVIPKISYMGFKRKILCPATMQTTQIWSQDKNWKQRSLGRWPPSGRYLPRNLTSSAPTVGTSQRSAFAGQLGLDHHKFGVSWGNLTSQASSLNGTTGQELMELLPLVSQSSFSGCLTYASSSLHSTPNSLHFLFLKVPLLARNLHK